MAGVLPFLAPAPGRAAGGPASSRTEVIGSASARVAAAGPIVAGLALEAGFATSTVELVGRGARGESRTMSAGAAALFLGMAGAPPVLPEPTRADSAGTGDAERTVAAPAGEFVRVGHERAHAEEGASEAATRIGDITFGAASVLGGSSHARIGDDGARSLAALAELRLGGSAGPEVRLSQLEWRAEQGMGRPAQAAFSIGSITVGGQPVAVGAPEQTGPAIEAANAALVPQGIRLEAPAVTADSEGGRVGPLRLELRDPPLNRAVAAAAYSPLAPAASQVQESLASAAGDERVDQALLGANVALSLVLGNGGVGVELGGAMVGLTQREAPDLGSLLGGTNPLPPGSGPSGDGDAGGSGPEVGTAAGPNASGGTPPGLPPEGFRPGSGAGAEAGAGVTGAEPPPETEAAAAPVWAAEPAGRQRPGRLPLPLAAAALAAGLALAGIDRAARRWTAAVVASLRPVAALVSGRDRPGHGRRRLVTVGVAVLSIGGLALMPSRVPVLPAGDGVAAGSPIPSAAAPVDTGVPAAAGTAGGGAASTDTAGGPAATSPAGDSPDGGVSTTPGGRTDASAGGGRAAGGGAATTGPRRESGREGGAVGAAAPSAVTRSRDCPGGEMQDRNSTYSPPCLKFTGENGGATSQGVSAEVVTVAMREPETFDAGISKQGQLSDTPADLKRSILAYVDYFNRVYQTYGRRVEVVFYKPKVPLFAGAEGGYQEEANADALTVGQQIKAFSDLTASAPAYADALVRQRVIGYGTFHMSKSWYQARAPWAWGNLPDCTWIAEQSVDYLIKRLGRSPARFAGDPAMRSRPRAIGLVVPDSPWYQECADHADRLYQAAGFRFARRVNYPLNFNQSSQTATNVVAQMKAAGVTSVMCMCDPLLPYFATPQANQQNYHPEWLVAGFGATDIDLVGQFYDQSQWSHAFGMGVVGELRSGYESESYRAYKAVRSDEPAQLRDVAYYPLRWFFSCLQMAGPNLNPKTFEAGCFALPPAQGELGLIRFGPGDYTAVSDAREIYWDPQGVSPWNGRKGRYVATLGGRRFSGPWPEGEPALPPPR